MTKIEWTEKTWNPIVGCSLASPGCTNCYAADLAHRLGANPTTPHYAATTRRGNGHTVWTGKVALAPDSVLDGPLLRNKPTTWFVNSMGDLFHEDVPDHWIDEVFTVMALCPQHTFQVLTKRSARMRDYVTKAKDRIYDLVCDAALDGSADVILIADRELAGRAPRGRQVFLGDWPLPNVWLGVSVEDQRRADERIPGLLATPAALRFISAEPLLGPVNLLVTDRRGHDISALRGIAVDPTDPDGPDEYYRTDKIDWVICGGESGRNARPMHPDWARGLRDQCAGAGVPFFFKQWGEFLCAGQSDKDKLRRPPEGKAIKYLREDGLVADSPISALVPGGIDDDDGQKKIIGGEEVIIYPNHQWVQVARVGKKAAGAMLDGREWREMP